MSIIDYKVIDKNSAESLEHSVREAIKEGWQPYGSMVVTAVSGKGYSGNTVAAWAYVQSMVQYDIKTSVEWIGEKK